MQYAECLKKYYNAVDGTFYNAISHLLEKADDTRHRSNVV